MQPRRRNLLLVLALATAACSPSDDSAPTSDATAVVVEAAWGQWFDEADVEGTFVLKEVGSDTVLVWNEDRAATRRRPASTFKILNSMIILETGVLSGVDEIVEWDGVDRGIDVWNQDHTLRTGIEVSAVWMYQHLAREIGETEMQEWVDRTGYVR